jgi:magnesium-transporting ATPase (P-type)
MRFLAVLVLFVITVVIVGWAFILVTERPPWWGILLLTLAWGAYVSMLTILFFTILPDLSDDTRKKGR